VEFETCPAFTRGGFLFVTISSWHDFVALTGVKVGEDSAEGLGQARRAALAPLWLHPFTSCRPATRGASALIALDAQGVNLLEPVIRTVLRPSNYLPDRPP